MRLLYLQQLLVLPHCPGNPRCFEFARHWTRQGNEVHFISSTAGIPADHPVWQYQLADGSYRYQGVYIHFVDLDYHHLWSFRKRIRAFLTFYRRVWAQREQWQGFDAIIAYTAPLTVGDLGRRMSQSLGIPFLYEVADVWPDVPIGMGVIPAGPWRGWLLRRTRNIYQQADTIVAFSEGMKTQICQHKVSPDKVHVIHNGATIVEAPSRERSASGLRLIYTGTIGLANDVSQIALAAKRIQELGRQDIQFRIIGSGNDEARLKVLLKKLELQNLRWTPRVSKEQAYDALSEAEVGISCFASYPVLEANSATKFYDYLLAAMPVLINHQGWQAEYLANHHCGLSSEQGDLEAFVKNILYLADHPQERKQMGQNARKLAISHFDRYRLSDRMLQLLLALKK
ncbi:MAG: glycosyltransferase family 4 protein [Bacteroidota bacterium]